MTLYPETRHLQLSHPMMGISDQFPFRLALIPLLRHFPAHRHEYLECAYVVEGEGYQIVNGKRLPLQPGTFYFLLPYQVHELFPNPQSAPRLYNCMFDMNFLFWSSAVGQGMEQLLHIHEDFPSYVQLDASDRVVFETILADMMEQSKGDHVWKEQFLHIKLMELLIRFDWLRRPQQTASEERQVSGTSRIWAIVRYIHLHYQDPLALAELAEQFHMSASNLSELFKKHVGVNFVHFLQHLRVRHACGLLASTDMSKVDIVAEVGFGSLRSFTRTFREQKGMSPSEYRQLHRGKAKQTTT